MDQFPEKHVVAMELRGYGDSYKPTSIRNYRVNFLVEDVQEVMEGLGYDQGIVVGHDWGGILAWSFAHMYPHMVSRLAILNCPHPRLYQVSEWMKLMINFCCCRRTSPSPNFSRAGTSWPFRCPISQREWLRTMTVP